MEMSQDPEDECHFIVRAEHPAGCPFYEETGLISFIDKIYWIPGLVLMAFGLVTTFFGGLLLQYLTGTLIGLIAFIVGAIIMD